MTELIQRLVNGQDLTFQECYDVFSYLLKETNSIEATAFFLLLHQKGETVEELAGLVRGLHRQVAQNCSTIPFLDRISIGATTSDLLHISNGSAILAKECGAMTSSHLTHPLPTSLNKLSKIKKVLGGRTTLDLIEPLWRLPAASAAMISVENEHYISLIAETLRMLGIKRGFVFHGQGVNVLTPIDETRGVLIVDEQLIPFNITPAHFNLGSCKREELQLSGKRSAIEDTIALNAGVMLYLSGIQPSIQDGLDLARETKNLARLYEFC